MKHFFTYIIIGFILLFSGGYIALCFLAGTDRMLPKTTVNDVDISGMTLDEAVSALEKENGGRHTDSLTISLDGNNYTIATGDAIKTDYKAAAKNALTKSNVSFFLRGAFWLDAFLTGDSPDAPPVNADTDRLLQALSESGFPDIDTYIRKAYELRDGSLFLHAGAAEEKIDKDKLIEDIITAFRTGTPENVIPCPMIPAADADLETIYNEVHKEAANATLDPEKNYSVIDDMPGIDFDKKEAEAALNQAKDGIETYIPLIYTEPEVTAADLKKNMFRDTLSTCTTKVSGTPNCVTNIKLAAEKCDGVILPAGAVFSFNDTVGEQTAARGFKTADAIYRGEIVQAYGGGICQVSTNIFAAALYTDLDILEHWNHDYVSSYIDAGLDAAVAWGSLDMRIQNTSPYPVRIDVECTDESLTVALVGTKTDNSRIEVETEVLKDSAPGTMDVITRRKIYMEDNGNVLVQQVAFSSYVI